MNWLLAVLALGISLPHVLSQAPPDRKASIFFSKKFPGSLPPYFEVLVDSSGRVIYKEAPNDPAPLEFTLPSNQTAKLFDLAKQLDFFQESFASKKKVAFTGDKILRYNSPEGQNNEVEFVFTENRIAGDLVNWFERVAQTERHLIELERVAQFDRLGVNKTLLQFQIFFDKERVVAPQQFLKILRKIAEGKKYVQVARSRAAALVDRIETQTTAQ